MGKSLVELPSSSCLRGHLLLLVRHYAIRLSTNFLIESNLKIDPIHYE